MMNDITLLESELNELIFAIKDYGIRGFTLSMLEVAPTSFWKGKASTDHHPFDERIPGGNLLHTVRMVRLLKIICEDCEIEGYELDQLISAGILHDLCKSGKDGNYSYTVDEHPYLVRELAEEHGVNHTCGTVILKLIEAHMGKWGKVPQHLKINPYTALHLADSLSSRAELIWQQLCEVEDANR